MKYPYRDRNCLSRFFFCLPGNIIRQKGEEGNVNSSESNRTRHVHTGRYRNFRGSQHGSNLADVPIAGKHAGLRKNDLGAGRILDHGHAVCIFVCRSKDRNDRNQTPAACRIPDVRMPVLGAAALFHRSVFWWKLRSRSGNRSSHNRRKLLRRNAFSA